ncbi:hypothetical protein B0T26DRAFT_700281 [Lasiosphaeria miniovina]|uniref:Uncharacterized protein n=1 Tax=Lasiosphaeria miniovina TaxID=1954250 RepID=A0AA40ATT0_9PEZI|nr:uncharacterized protein B0T26DRAFT_700281 [Lasiosphaeria miniovina]KAK0721784.1 hypothetical protein B0T26DRAFT_700281 [Lasiosphaeria miniovina]
MLVSAVIMQFSLAFLGVVIGLAPPAVPQDDQKFRSWYPYYRYVLDSTLEKNCSTEYAAYLENQAGICQYYCNATSMASERVIECLLSSLADCVKSNMQSASALLGIMLVALPFFGTGTEESALLMVIAQRPLLTLLLVTGSPVASPLQPFEYNRPVDILHRRKGRFRSLGTPPRHVVLAAEYATALLALVNTLHVSWQLGLGVVTMISSGAIYLPSLWVVMGVAAHLVGALCLRSFICVKDNSPATSSSCSVLRSEFTISCKKYITVRTPKDENKLFLVLSMLTSAATTSYTIFGFLCFASIQFISVYDALIVIGRYTVSVVVCRFIALYELSGLANVVEDGDNDK